MGNKMVSIVTMAANALGGIIVSALRAFFSLISWFLKNFFNCIKYFFCVLPVTAVVFSGLFVVNIVLLITGSFHVSEADFLPAEGVNEANRLLDAGTNTVAVMYRELISWWNDTVYVLHVGPAYIVLLVVTILMFVPVVSVLLCISVFASYSAVLFGAVCVDAAIYILRLILGKSPAKQIQGRYFLLFRDAGKKHDEKTYEKWLRRHHDEFENDEYEKSPRWSKVDTFYEDEASDDRYEDDYYEDDYYKDEAEYEDEEDYPEDSEYGYPDEYSDDEEYYEEEYDDDESDEDYDDENPGFDFFAGCSSKESLDKKYRSLVKLYHPDNMDGDTRALQEINVQYDKAKKSKRFQET
ncbi:J domain-containing protein [Butyrivibrio sp. DSM 10294]|uniref:J domain-containing protein n=1 Tax=Butyrivibrio sp. DSM 10294 TaxID=2972457 RepID=UPI00234EE12D|nr:J domain-containing protein [Butyrivibrio sp. DSM 10294]